ncbi:phosphatidylinositol-4- kinase [Tieghemiomyces parasiticus]|uniref:1-phosphatidylinositol 4-kinase n=1 Tax=Tieghemiomyces parasiticus TaxID=78921 RepID=A0A9W8ACM9_9FUNG|nr:phosphatidylinositol-4- kinase [Tieghemiomyces parasiticus]
MDGLEFPDLHHQILHQLATTLALQKEKASHQGVPQLWNQFPTLPVAEAVVPASPAAVPAQPAEPADGGRTGPPGDTSPPPLTNGHAVPGPTAINSSPATPELMTARQQSAILAGARWALETKSYATRCQLVQRLLPYLAALPGYTYPENYRWKEISPEDRFVYEFTSYLLNIAAEELVNPATDEPDVPHPANLAHTILEAVWSYVESHVHLLCDASPVRVCTFVLPSLNGAFQALEDAPLAFPASWVVKAYDLAKRLLHGDVLDTITRKIAAARRGTSVGDASDSGPRYARRVLKRYADSGAPFSSNAVIVRYLGFVRNVLVRRSVRTDIDADCRTKVRVASRGRSGTTAAPAVNHLNAAGLHDEAPRAKPPAPVATGAGGTGLQEPETYEECWAQLKARPQPRFSENAAAPDDPSAYARAVRGLFVLSQRYWADLVNLMREPSPTGSSPDETVRPAPTAGPTPNVGWSPQLTVRPGGPGPAATLAVPSAHPLPPTASTPQWYLAPELYVLDLLPRCLQVAGLACYVLGCLDEPFLNDILTFLISPLARACPLVVITICDVLEVIAGSFPDYRAEILQSMIDYVNHPPANAAEVIPDASGLERNPAEVALDDELLGYVVHVLTRCLALNAGGDQVALSTLHLFMNTLFAMHLDTQKVPLAHRISRNAIIALSDVTLALHNDRITVWCVSTLLRSAKKHDVSLRRLIIEKLAQVALIAPTTSFVEVVELLALVGDTRHTREAGIEAHVLRETVWRTMRYLATRANQRPDLYNRFLALILNWFVDKGVEIQTTACVVRTRGVIHAKELGVFLPVIQALLEHRDFEPHLKASHDMVSLMRNVWFHLVLNGCLVDPSWIAEYNDALVVMAAKSPILVHESAINYLETDLEYNSVLRRGYSEQSLSSLRATLASYLPDHAAAIRSLSFAQTTFLLAIWYVETTRGRAGNCTQVLRYFDNPGVTSSKLVGLIEAIADRTLKEYVQERRFQFTSAVVNEQMKGQLRALLISSCSRLERVSRLSRIFVKGILRPYPQALLDSQLLFTLLELVQLVWESCQAEIEDEFYPVYSFTSRPLGITLQLPDSMSYRKTLLASFAVAARDWLLLTTRAAPLEMDNLLQDYLARTDNVTVGFRPHVGRSLALDIGRSLYAAVAGTLTSALFGAEAGGDPVPVMLPVAGESQPGAAGFAGGALTTFGTPSGTAPAFTVDAASAFLFQFGRRMYYRGEQHGWATPEARDEANRALLDELRTLHARACRRDSVPAEDLYAVFCRAAAVVKSQPTPDRLILHLLCWTPVHLFTDDAMKMAAAVWTDLLLHRPELEPVLMAELVACWTWTVRHRRGLFTDRFTPRNPFGSKMSYAPTDKTARYRAYQGIAACFHPHVTWILFFTSRLEATQFHHPDTALLLARMFQLTFPALDRLSSNPLARQGRFLLARLGLKLLEHLFAGPVVVFRFRLNVYALALSWFTVAPRWTFSGSKRSIAEELRLLIDCYGAVEADLTTATTAGAHVQWSGSIEARAKSTAALLDDLPPPAVDGRAYTSPELPSPATRQRLVRQKRLILLLLASEIRRLVVWNSASDPAVTQRDAGGRFREPAYPEEGWRQVVRDAWDFDPNLAVYLPARLSHPAVADELRCLVLRDPRAVVRNPDALPHLLPRSQTLTLDQKRYLLYWAPVAPVAATAYLTGTHSAQPLVVQYAMRALAQYPIDVVFFYVPQLVQALRYDLLGYVERYILDAALISQLFAHQIIWNMKANMYKDEEGMVPDTLKPTLDRMIAHIVGQLSGPNQAFYEREFAFFGKVTGISGKLKPFIKKPKEEKKKKIDEEMRQIAVDVGVYLPSNPDGTVVDIDYNSGRPLQSHAKAPFMATFYVKRRIAATDEVQELIDDHGSDDSVVLVDSEQVLTPTEPEPTVTVPPADPKPPSNVPVGGMAAAAETHGAPRSAASSFVANGGGGGGAPLSVTSTHAESQAQMAARVAEVIVKQSAIFKVGDDCRQDVLALQLIAVFKNIFTSVGLDLYLFPYRVVATNPGCGMIDVIPNAISRDQLGREKVNSLYDYFVTKYGGEDSVSFQKARHNFVQSVAAYSLISFLLQIKDRHNGNIMIDDRGHMVHIDFGFILDISPGGINFESSPFKLTTEMINVMGGSATAQPFKLFADLCVKAYLASRPYAELIVETVRLMADSGLPCFKGESTLVKLRQRFQLDKTERDAAQYMLDRIHESFQNRRTVLYDSFQKATNGIPY